MSDPGESLVYKVLMLTPDSDYRDVLREELVRRSQADPRYSLNAFAKFLGLSPSRLSEIFNGKQGLSRTAAQKISGKLELGSREAELFCDIVEKEHARSEEARQLAKLRLQEKALDYQYAALREDTFHIISDWYHFAILQLTELASFKEEPKWIATKLGINSTAATVALERLLRNGLLIREKGRLKPSSEFISAGDDLPSEAIKKFHRQILEKASASIGLQTIDERFLSANIIAIDPKDLPKANEMMRRFRRRFANEISTGVKKRFVYCLSMQFFRISEKEEI